MNDEPKLEFLVCQACDRRFGLATIGHLSSDKLPEDFDAICPHCHTKWTYAKASIQVQKL